MKRKSKPHVGKKMHLELGQPGSSSIFTNSIVSSVNFILSFIYWFNVYWAPILHCPRVGGDTEVNQTKALLSWSVQQLSVLCRKTSRVRTAGTREGGWTAKSLGRGQERPLWWLALCCLLKEARMGVCRFLEEEHSKRKGNRHSLRRMLHTCEEQLSPEQLKLWVITFLHRIVRGPETMCKCTL